MVEVLVKVVDVCVWILKLGPKRGNRLSLGTITSYLLLTSLIHLHGAQPDGNVYGATRDFKRFNTFVLLSLPVWDPLRLYQETLDGSFFVDLL